MLLGAFGCSGVSRPKWISVAKSAKLRDRKVRSNKASFTFGGDLRQKVHEENSATESSSLGKFQGYGKEAWLLCWEDKSDLIKVHPELNSVSSPQPSVRLLSTETFPKIRVGSTRMHLLLCRDIGIIEILWLGLGSVTKHWFQSFSYFTIETPLIRPPRLPTVKLLMWNLIDL